MNINNLNFLNIFSKLYNLCFGHKRVITVLIGSFGTTISVFLNKKIIDNIFVTKKNHQELEIFSNILARHKGYSIFFLIESKDARLYHESLPVIQNVIQYSPVKSFLKHNIPNNYTVAYDILEISKKNIETWFAIFSSIPLTNNLKNWICYAIDHEIQFGGIYHLQLEAFDILDRIMLATETHVEANHLQIFIAPTKTFGAFIFIRNSNHVIYTSSVEYPEEQSDEYLQGLLENEISNCLMKLKSYISSNKMKTSAILLINESLLESFKNFDIVGLDKLITISTSKLYSIFLNFIGYENNVADNLIAGLFSLKRNFLSINKETSFITKLTWMYNLILKPFQLIIIILLFKIALSGYNIIITKSEITNLNKESIKLVNQFNQLKSQYPNQKNFNKILDYYTLNTLINSQFIEIPDKIIGAITNNPNSQNTIIQSIVWIKDKKDSIENFEPECEIELKYYMENVVPSKLLNSVETYVTYLKSSLPDYNIEYNIDKQKLLRISNISSISLIIKLSKVSN